MSTARTLAPPAAPAALDVEAIRRQFPILERRVHGHPLVYLDNASTAQKPLAVLEAGDRYNRENCANIHRGVHEMSGRATADYEAARGAVRRFLGAAEDREIIFVRGATEGINLVARSYLGGRLKPGDEILITAMEHHSNIVPWQMLAGETGAIVKAVPIEARGELVLEAYERLLGPRTRMVAVTHQSNSLGTINPVKEIIARAHRQGVPVLVDGAQAVVHQEVRVRDLDADFYVFSGHKVYGPTGIGALYARASLLEEMPPYQGGGDMILSVTFEKTVYNEIPWRFEAGTPNISGAIGLGAAVSWLTGLGLDRVATHEKALLEHATRALEAIPGLRMIGTSPGKASILSFVLGDLHPHDIGTILDGEGVAVRTGHHCTQPAMLAFGIPATVRASLAVYNTPAEIDALVAALHRAAEVLG